MTGQTNAECEHNHEQNNESKHKNESIYVCSYEGCDCTFKRLSRFKVHLRGHNGERPYICTIDGCDRSFASMSYLTKHLKRPHNDKIVVKNDMKKVKEYLCENCGKIFKTKYQLRLHSYVHTGVKPFQCEKCDNSYTTKSKLRRHNRSHEGYRCDRNDCDFIANKWSDLRKHIANDHKVCPQCDVCGKKFNNKYNLKLHRLTHTDDRSKIQCPFDGCSHSYSKRSNLQIHIKSNHEKMMHKCTFEGCEKVFYHKKSLKKHFDSHSNPKIKIPKKSSIIKRKKCMAEELSGAMVSNDEKNEILKHDLNYRKCNDIYDSTFNAN